MNETALSCANLSRYYRTRDGLLSRPKWLKALDNVSFELSAGQTLAVVGESGCGKSTLARVISMIEPPTRGQLVITGTAVAEAPPRSIRTLRSRIQIIFQDPYGSLNPRKKVGSILQEPLIINTDLSRHQRRDAAAAMLDRVDMRPEHISRYPHMFSGGQRQRIAIARALMLKPRIVVADEPVSALDVSIQAQILNLLMDLQASLKLALVFISHNLGVVHHIADHVLVMYLGRTVEQGAKQTIFNQPLHPYTRALMASTPFVDPSRRAKRVVLTGELPSPLNPPSGCAFHQRCPRAQDRCQHERPNLRDIAGRRVACHFTEQQSIDDRSGD